MHQVSSRHQEFATEAHPCITKCIGEGAAAREHTNKIRLCEMVPFKAYLFLFFFGTRYHWWTIGADIGPNRSNLIIFSTSRQVEMKIQDIDLYEVPVPRIFKNTKGAEQFDKSSYTKIRSTGYTRLH